MSERDDGGPAFPVVHAIIQPPGHYTMTPEAQPGMALLDYFAAAAMQGFAAACNTDVPMRPYEVAQYAYNYAEAMLRERTKRAERAKRDE